MSLKSAITEALQARELKPGDLLARMQDRDRSTVYRLLNGDTRDTKISTMIALCAALEIDPNEFLALAGLWSEFGPAPDALDLRMRRTLSVTHKLALPYKLVAVTQIERLIDTWQEAASGALSIENGE